MLNGIWKNKKLNNMKEYRFVGKWDENCDIQWRKECRIELNKIIKKYNKWQYKHDFDRKKALKLLTLIEYGKQTIGSRNGGSGYLEQLLDMEKFVEGCFFGEINT